MGTEKRRASQLWDRFRTKLKSLIGLTQKSGKFKKKTELFEQDTDFMKKWDPNKLVIAPDNKCKVAFEIILSLMSLFEISYVSYSTSFGHNETLAVNILLPFFILGLILSFFYGFVQDIVVVMSLKQTALKYLKTWFVIDFLATVPIYFIWIEALNLRLLRLLSFGRITRCIVRLVNGAISKCKVMNMQAQGLVGTSIRIILYLQLFLHLTACLLRSLTKDHLHDSWICNLLHNFPNGESIADCETYPFNDYDLYVAAIYWIMATLTTVGYGDYYATSVREKLVIMVIELLGIGFFGYLIGRLNTLLKLIDIKDEVQSERKESLEKFLIQLDRASKKRSLNSTYVQNIESFFGLYWKANHRTILEKQFFTQLPHTIQNELVDYLFGNVINHFKPFFQGTSIGFRRDIVKNLRFMVYEKFPKRTHWLFKADNEKPNVIMKRGEIPHSVVFILRGEIYYGNRDGKYQFFTLSGGSFFGQEYILFQEKSSYSIFHQHSEKVLALEIDRQSFMEICSFYQSSVATLKERALLRRQAFRKKREKWMKKFKRQMQIKIEAMQAKMGATEIFQKKKQQSGAVEDSESTIKINLVNGSLSPVYNSTQKRFSTISLGTLLRPQLSLKKQEVPGLVKEMKRHLRSDSFTNIMNQNSEDQKEAKIVSHSISLQNQSFESEKVAKLTNKVKKLKKLVAELDSQDGETTQEEKQEYKSKKENVNIVSDLQPEIEEYGAYQHTQPYIRINLEGVDHNTTSKSEGNDT